MSVLLYVVGGDVKRIRVQANLLYANAREHAIGVDGWTVEDNLRWRKRYAPPILKKLKTALLKVTNSPGKYPPKSEMFKAADCDLDTNRIERGAIFYTLACSCRLCGVNFFDYLSDVIDRMAALPPKQPHEVYRNLLPDRWGSLY